MKANTVLFIMLFILSVGLFADGTLPYGSGTEADPYQINTLENLEWFWSNHTSWNAYFIQTADIDATETYTWNYNNGYTPIGTQSEPFTGNYDGQDYLIDNLQFSLPNMDYSGFFGYCSGAYLENILLTNVGITGRYYVGGLAGSVRDNSEINSCSVVGTVNGQDNVGGLIGLVDHYCMVTFCYSSGSVSGTYHTGGLVGSNYYLSTITNCFSTASVSGVTYAGGLAGANIISNIQNCYSTGNVSGNIWYYGLVGETDNNNPGIWDSFWDIETSGNTEGNGTGKTTAEMKDVATFTSLATAGLNNPWDFVGNPYDDSADDNVWAIMSSYNSGYPFFSSQYLAAEFTASETTIPEGGSVQFTDFSSAAAIWSFPVDSSSKVNGP